MDEAMAPPLKRRKLSTSVSEQYLRLDNSTAPADAAQSYPHGVDSPKHTYSSQAPSRTAFPQDDGQEQRIQKPVVGGIADFKVLVPRQGTGSSSSSIVSTESENAVSVLIDSITSMTSSVSVSFSTTASSPTLPADTIPAGVTPSESSSSRSAHSSASSYGSSTGSSSISSINETSSITSSASRSTSTATSESSSISQNLTTSAIILEGESSTTTSKTTINLDNQTSSTSITDSAFLFLVTLSNGDVMTLSRHSGAYTTTLDDGEVFTIPSISATTTSERTSTSSRTSTASRTSSTSSSSSEQPTVTSTMQVTGAVAGQGESTATYSSTTSSTSAASGGGGGGNNDPPAGTIAGGVVGGAAGLAVLVLIAMLFVRWYRRKGQVGHRELPPGSSTSPDSPEQPTDRSGPGMAERAGLMPFAAALPALFRHQNRGAEGPASSERGFTRVSGRKLPSAFSEGMSSEGARSQPPPGMPLSGSPPDERNLSSTSFYRDSAGFYGGDGTGEPGRSSTSPTSPTSPSSSAPIHSGPEMMTMSPGPQRQPQVHAGGPYTLSPATSEHPNSPPAAAAQFARSDTPSSLRNSRFTEDM